MAARKGKDHHFYGTGGHWKDREGCAILGYQKGRNGIKSASGKPVMSPTGVFGSLSLAAAAYGVRSHYTISRLAERGTQGYDTGWHFI